MSTYIKAGLWTKKQIGNKGELDLDLLIKTFASGSIATTAQGTIYSINPNTNFETAVPIDSIILGVNAGSNSIDANASIILGDAAGMESQGAVNSIFMGSDSGKSSVDGGSSNFLGEASGSFSNNCNNSNFLGISSAFEAVNAYNCNFFGTRAGRRSSGNNVNAFGYSAGENNTLSNQTIFSNASLPSFVNRAAAVAAITVVLGASAGSTYLYYNETTFGIEAVRL